MRFPLCSSSCPHPFGRRGKKLSSSVVFCCQLGFNHNKPKHLPAVTHTHNRINSSKSSGNIVTALFAVILHFINFQNVL